MAFQMKDSPHKRGEIQGTESASALKAKKWIVQQITKNAPKVLDKIDDAWVTTRDAIFGGSKKTVKNVSKTKKTNVKKSNTQKDTTQEITKSHSQHKTDGGPTTIVKTTKPDGSYHTVETSDKTGNVMSEGSGGGWSWGDFGKVTTKTMKKQNITDGGEVSTLLSGKKVPFDPLLRQIFNPKDIKK
jgi:hypothetical protein